MRGFVSQGYTGTMIYPKNTGGVWAVAIFMMFLALGAVILAYMCAEPVTCQKGTVIFYQNGTIECKVEEDDS